MDKSDQLSALQKVLSNKIFSKSPSTSMLLKYLVEASLANKDLKENIISVELYGKDYADEKSAAHMRVNIYHLRKKLEKYYASDGKNDNIKLVIEKGQYHVEFIERAKDPKVIIEKRRKKRYFFLAASLVLIFSISFFSYHNKKTPIWHSYFSNKLPTTLFVGDFFGVMGTTVTGRNGWNRDYNINNLQDYYTFLEENPDKKDFVYPANYPYVTGLAATGTLNISRVFHANKSDFDIRFTSQTSIKDISQVNSIYIGPVKNKNIFLDLFNDKNSKFKINQYTISYKNSAAEKDTLINLSIGDGTQYEHAVVSRMKGPNGTEQFVFFSDHDIGVKATTEKFANEDWIKSTFFEMIGEEVDYFTALFLVKGKERTNLELELLLWDKL
ncbi:helix-turn-helix domain-containing protein [Belliella kenyensis]|uniref:Helix-turn-helix domain-containing protein n=1 Tax=Belliella kenyensis TaxID=1472724 RepID=A0ABV8EJA6_9BACT|nr:helix-turn-helix domain-containing protein [Belliella kenyensis]MCH7400983.1 helix-turn-helix domain-containing protein [Belliella kenyensis]MDN3603981.1 helix-turn-helix domain-containing protein [Belliella kenyensis]